jgi:hypothetical protein
MSPLCLTFRLQKQACVSQIKTPPAKSGSQALFEAKYTC